MFGSLAAAFRRGSRARRALARRARAGGAAAQVGPAAASIPPRGERRPAALRRGLRPRMRRDGASGELLLPGRRRAPRGPHPRQGGLPLAEQQVASARALGVRHPLRQRPSSQALPELQLGFLGLMGQKTLLPWPLKAYVKSTEAIFAFACSVCLQVRGTVLNCN